MSPFLQIAFCFLVSFTLKEGLRVDNSTFNECVKVALIAAFVIALAQGLVKFAMETILR